MLTREDIEAFADDQPVREEEVKPLCLDWMNWSMYALYMNGFTSAANSLFIAAYPVDERKQP